MIAHLIRRFTRHDEIPPPCWLPRELGPLRTCARAGHKATISLRIENADVAARTFTIETSGDDSDTTVSSASVPIEPYERATVTITVALPLSARPGSRREVLVWVRGCHTHVLRWTLEVSRHDSRCVKPVAVRDHRDFTHHWYDHFYCEHPCGLPSNS